LGALDPGGPRHSRDVLFTCALDINVDTGATPDLDVFYDCLVAGFDEVLALAD
jgi:hypothetical protein